MAFSDGDHPFDLISARDIPCRVVGIDQHQQSNVIIHFRLDVVEVDSPPLFGIEAILDGRCPIHLGVGHVGRIVRPGSEHLVTRF